MKKKLLQSIYLLFVITFPLIVQANRNSERVEHSYISPFQQENTFVSYGINRMNQISLLPVLDHGVRVNYEGSIDKQGGNADWDWFLYQDECGEWVLFDVKGPGCIYNFVQHRYLSSEDPIFRFYFDEEEQPRITIKLSEFGEKYPFLSPLSAAYIGPEDNGRGPIRVVRSFVPMPFQKACKITSNIKLEGPERDRGEGGWGHVVYHSYTSADGIVTYNGKEEYESLIQKWKNTGTDPKEVNNPQQKRVKEQLLSPGRQVTLFNHDKEGIINSLRLYLTPMNPDRLQDIWIHATWDNHSKEDISAPIGCFFGNSLGYNSTNYLLMGASTDGWFYNYFPMPFWENATLTLENRSSEEITLAFAEISYSENNLDKAKCGYFRSSAYYDRKHTPAADSQIGILHGTGKLVAAHITCYGERSNIITCEGDVRVHIDGIRTPQVESDGSESYICYGWGFPTPAETHPSGGYDGLSDNPWSMTRLCIGDSYPFYSELRFGIESGESNNQYLEHSGILLYYGKDQVSLIKTDSLDLNNSRSVKQHKYKTKGSNEEQYLESFFEGDQDDIAVTGKVIYNKQQSNFVVAIQPQNQGVKLRRRSDQHFPLQCARVFVDGEEVTERKWYVADSNPYKRWLEDDFEIPRKYTEGKTSLQIQILPESATNDGEITWNESTYEVFCYLPL